MSPEVFVALDLEFTQPTEKIIQIGAVVGNVYTKEVFEELSVFINPHEPLTEYITKLTGITQKDVDAGETLIEGHNRLKSLRVKYKAHGNPLTWGGGDSVALFQQTGIPAKECCFGRRWIDVKTIYQFYRMIRKEKIQAGLSKAMSKCGLNFKGRKHNAKSDARNTFLFYCWLLEAM